MNLEMKISEPIIALDFPNKELTMSFLDRFPRDQHLFVKVGMELFYSEGQELIEELKNRGYSIFLDLKCHDIPHTVERAMKVIGKMHVDLTTIHAAGGSEMIQAAKEGILAGSGNHQPAKILAVTQLTSISPQMLAEEQLIKVPLTESVKNYAKVAQKNGADGIVCSANEAQMLYQTCGDDFLKITPGIRLAGDSVNDQKRVMTPAKAARQHSNGLVVGRSITQALDVKAAYEQVKNEWLEANV